MADFSTEPSRHNPRRRNKDTNKAVALAASGNMEEAEDRAPEQPWMEINKSWCDEVKAIFMAVRQDPMAQFMTPMSWAELYLKCSAWDKEFKTKFLGIDKDGVVHKGKAPLPPQVLSDISKTLDRFGGNEKARREMKILIDPNPDAAQQSALGDAKMAAKKAIARPARRGLER